MSFGGARLVTQLVYSGCCWRAIGFVSLGSVLLPLAVGFGLGFLLPDSLMAPAADRSAFALFVGVAMAVSALPVIAKTLLDMRLLHRNVGQLIIGAAGSASTPAAHNLPWVRSIHGRAPRRRKISSTASSFGRASAIPRRRRSHSA